MVNFYPDSNTPAVATKTMDPSAENSEEQMVEMAVLPPKDAKMFQSAIFTTKTSACPAFKVCGDPDSPAVEWIEFVQDQMDKLLVCIVVAGLVFFSFYSLLYKEFKPFNYWVIIVALTSGGDNIGSYGANIPRNKCRTMVLVHLLTGLAALYFAVKGYLKCREHDEIWDAIENKLENGDYTWFNNPDNFER